MNLSSVILYFRERRMEKIRKKMSKLNIKIEKLNNLIDNQKTNVFLVWCYVNSVLDKESYLHVLHRRLMKLENKTGKICL